MNDNGTMEYDYQELFSNNIYCHKCNIMIAIVKIFANKSNVECIINGIDMVCTECKDDQK